MQNAAEIANTIIVADSNLKSLAPRKTCEKVGGVPTPKLKLTSATYLTFRHNLTVSDELFKNVIEVLNKKLNVVLKDIEKDEEKTAEEDLIKKITPEKKEKTVVVNENVEAIKIVRKINNATKKEKIDTVLNNNKLLLTNPTNYLDHNGRLYKKANPKAIMIPAILQGICSEIGKNQDKYEFVEKEDKSNSLNWKDVFASVIVKDENKSQTEEEKNIIEDEYIDNPTKLTLEEFEKRKLQANIGEELKDIRELLNGFGQSTPFREGLIKREKSLKKMLEEVGMFESSSKAMNNYSSGKTTEIQKIIDDVTGYKEPLTLEEHEKKEQEINDYYSDPNVQNLIDDLRLKNKLFDMNQEEAYKKIDEAERVDNERKMELMSTRLIDGMKAESDFEKFNVNSGVDELENNKEKNYILNGAKEQARLLEARNNKKIVLNGVKEEAKMLNDGKEISELAKQYAKDILKFNNLIDSAKKYAKDIFEHDFILENAEKYAKDINEFNKVIDLSKIYAQDIYNKYAIKEMADKYAKDIYEYGNIADLAKQYAKDIFDGNRIIKGAEEQAKVLNEMNKIIDSARAYAQDIFNMNMMIDIKNGAEEQAEILFAKEKIANIIKKSENRLKNGSTISNNNDEQEKIREKLDEIVARSYDTLGVKQDNLHVNVGSSINNQNNAKVANENIKSDSVVEHANTVFDNKNTTNWSNLDVVNNNSKLENTTDAHNFEKDENLKNDNVSYKSSTENEVKAEKRKEEIEQARKIVDGLLGMFKVKVNDDDYIDMHKSGIEQAKMIQSNGNTVERQNATFEQIQDNSNKGYDILEMNVRYLSQVFPAKKIKLPGRDRVDNIKNAKNHNIEDVYGKTFRRAA